ncbi:MAG: hypothetical protein Q7R34_03380 [Dehalococcoidia bacterium]|nr:hypothetical protein [Dehalococcoidia bacterium]
MKKTKRIISYLQKQGYTEAQVESRLNNLTAPFRQIGKYGSTLPRNYQWIEDYPLLANLYELKAQMRIKQGLLLPNWVRKNILQVLQMAKTEDPDNADWQKLVWGVYWFTKFSAYEVVR